MYKIMIIEDDLTIARTISEHLSQWGYDTTCVTEFHNVADQVLRSEPQLVLLDIALPFYNGFHWCGEIRKFSKVPIIFISSASDNMNIVMAMNEMMQRLWESDQFIDDNTLTVNITRLRKKLAELGLEQWIITKKGLGYLVE